jgi:hypothetical protein
MIVRRDFGLLVYTLVGAQSLAPICVGLEAGHDFGLNRLGWRR